MTTLRLIAAALIFPAVKAHDWVAEHITHTREPDEDMPSPAYGMASWYGEKYRGKRMANGRAFDPGALTCATYAYPLGAWLLVEHDGWEVLVQVTDRGPDHRLHRLIDLSRASFARIAHPDLGVVRVKVTRVAGKQISK